MQEACAVLFWGVGRKYAGRKEARPNAHLPAVPHHSPPLPTARTKGDAEHRAPSPGPRLRLSGRLLLGTPTGAGPLPREPRRFGSHPEPQVALQEPAASSLPEDALVPAPNQPTPEFPGTPALARPGSRQPAGRVSLHSPRSGSGRAGLRPAEPLGAAAEAGPQSARSALRGRADAQARSRPHSCTDSPLLTPTRTRGRRAARAGPAPRRTRAREPKESLE